jgi:hypothetical protein
VDLQADHGLQRAFMPASSAFERGGARTMSRSLVPAPAMSWPPTGRPSTAPIGSDSAGSAGEVGRHGEHVGQVHGVRIVGLLAERKAGVGVVGVKSTSTPLSKTLRSRRDEASHALCLP